jgi:hypothetical protein
VDEFQEIWGIGYERKVDRTLETPLNGTSEKSILSWLYWTNATTGIRNDAASAKANPSDGLTPL